MVKTFKTAILSTFFLAIILCGVYPLVIFGFGKLFFYKKTHGSLVIKNNKVIGSSLIGKNFSGDGYFQPRASAAGDKGYDAANSSGSNLGPTSQKLYFTLRQRAAQYRRQNNLSPGTQIPPDAITASGSGLDPHISLDNAFLQVPRVAKARKMHEKQLVDLVHEFTELPILGHPRVNVLLLNLALDDYSSTHP